VVRLQMSGIHKCFDDKFCLKDVSFRVEAGEVFAFLGANGAGKTTKIRIILGLLKSQKGSVSILGDNGVSLDRKWIRIDQLEHAIKAAIEKLETVKGDLFISKPEYDFVELEKVLEEK